MSLIKRIETLRKRHSEIDQVLQDEQQRPLPDIIRVHQFKREKLLIKDEILKLSHFTETSPPQSQRQTA
jgi:hypothetical protein